MADDGRTEGIIAVIDLYFETCVHRQADNRKTASKHALEGALKRGKPYCATTQFSS